MSTEFYTPKTKIEEEEWRDYINQKSDAKKYFENCVRPRLDRSYKLYIGDNRDRADELKKKRQTWKSNIVVPYIHAVVETLKPRILDARPEFNVSGRNQDDNRKAGKINVILDYYWEKMAADNTAEFLTSSALIYGDGFIQVYWKKDEREYEFLKSDSISKNKLKWKKEKRIFYDGPMMEWVDNYSLWYDWHNVEHFSKQYWFRRLILSEEEIKRRYTLADENMLEMAFNTRGDLTDYGSIRTEVKLSHSTIAKTNISGSTSNMSSSSGNSQGVYSNSEIKLHEVFEWHRPFKDKFAVMVNDVPVLNKGKGYIPFPYDFKETQFVHIPYLKIPGEYEGYGLPMILENPQIMLNTIKNQRLDASLLSIHKMWILSPLANINKEELITRPMGIIYSSDPNGAREIQTADIKPSSYKEEELLKGDMRYTCGVDDFSMGIGNTASSATAVRHLRESTLERVRLFVNHLGDGYSVVMRYWLSMLRQFFTKTLYIRVVGDDGKELFPIIEGDDLMGEFDLKATVIPSIAGQMDVKKKQDMDLFQLLVNMPFIDPEKLTAKMLYDWEWDIENIKKKEEQLPSSNFEELAGMMDGNSKAIGTPEMPFNLSQVPPEVMQMIKEDVSRAGYAGNVNPMAELSSPVNLLTGGKIPPTVKGVPTTNPRGLNRGGKVNTNLPLNESHTNPEAQIQNRSLNIQK